MKQRDINKLTLGQKAYLLRQIVKSLKPGQLEITGLYGASDEDIKFDSIALQRNENKDGLPTIFIHTNICTG